MRDSLNPFICCDGIINQKSTTFHTILQLRQYDIIRTFKGKVEFETLLHCWKEGKTKGLVAKGRIDISQPKKVKCLLHAPHPLILYLNKIKSFRLFYLIFIVIWDDQHRNTNMNDKDYLVGQLTNKKHIKRFCKNMKRTTFTKAYICFLFKTQYRQNEGKAYQETKRGFFNG